MSTQNVSDLVHPIRFVERRKLLQTAAAVAAAGVLPPLRQRKSRSSPAVRIVEALPFC